MVGDEEDTRRLERSGRLIRALHVQEVRVRIILHFYFSYHISVLLYLLLRVKSFSHWDIWKSCYLVLEKAGAFFQLYNILRENGVRRLSHFRGLRLCKKGSGENPEGWTGG